MKSYSRMSNKIRKELEENEKEIKTKFAHNED